MSRGGTSKQNTTFKESQGVFQGANKNAGNLFNTLNPIYNTEATDPTNSPVYQAQNTASQQSLGGGVAAAKGEAGLRAARSGNRGGSQVAVNDSVRDAMRQNSNNSLRAVANTQQQGMEGLRDLYGTNVNQTMAALGLGGNIANNQASQPGWFQNMTDFMRAAGGLASSATGGKGISGLNG